MKLSRTVRIIAWCILLLLAASGIPLAGPVPLLRKDDPMPVTTELVEEKQEEEEEEPAAFRN